MGVACRYINADFVAGMVEEGERLLNAYSPTAVLRPFGWNYYHSGDQVCCKSPTHSC